MGKCIAYTRDGNPCQLSTNAPDRYCHVHKKQYKKRKIAAISTIGTIVLFLLGLLANITGVMGYFGWEVSKLFGVMDDRAVRIENIYDEGSSFVTNKLDPDLGVKYYTKDHKELITSVHPTIGLNITNISDEEWVKVASYLVVEITHVESITETLDLAHKIGGAASYPDHFAGVLAPSQNKIFGAPYVDGYTTNMSDKEKADRLRFDTAGYFPLDKGEQKVFLLNFETLPGYYYYFHVGVRYSYKGQIHTDWVSQEFVIASPTKTRNWEIFGDDFIYEGESAVTTNREKEIVQTMKEHRIEVEKDIFFPIP